MVPLWLQAGLWGFAAGSALLIGVAAAYLFDLPQRAIAAVMSLGAGVLISALSFELMGNSLHLGGLDSVAVGFITGATAFMVVNFYLSYRGAKYRKRSGDQQLSEKEEWGSGFAVAIGSLLDTIPESLVIGLSMLGGRVSFLLVTAVFVSNLPEGLSSTAGMKKAGRSRTYIFLVWIFVALASGISSLAGYWYFRHVSPEVVAAVSSMAAGTMLVMTADTMFPEAFGEGYEFAGFIAGMGFLAIYALWVFGW